MNAKDAILQMPRRADKWEEELLVKTFVNIGPLVPILRSENNQILFGRRGTGKTHVLKYLKSVLENENKDCCIFIDIRQIGSTRSIYSDKDIPTELRAVRLFTDILQEIRDQIITYITSSDENKDCYLSTVTPYLDGILQLLDVKKLSGNIRVECQAQNKSEGSSGHTLTIAERPSFTHSSAAGSSATTIEGTIYDGPAIDFLDFSSVFQNLQSILRGITPHKIWILIDEFAELTTELQIALSDMFRRVLCPLKDYLRLLP